jgi:hypothetical protein
MCPITHEPMAGFKHRATGAVLCGRALVPVIRVAWTKTTEANQVS